MYLRVIANNVYTKMGVSRSLLFEGICPVKRYQVQFWSHLHHSNLENIEFLRCGQDNFLSVVKDKEMNGDSVFEVAGQGSLYVIAKAKVCSHDSFFYWVFTTASFRLILKQTNMSLKM